MNGIFKRSNHIFDLVFVIILMAIFLMSLLMMIALGASVYKRNIQIAADHTKSITASSYILEKVRQNDVAGGVKSGHFLDQSALLMQTEIGDDLYITYIYCYDGYLREVMTKADNQDLTLESGQKILRLKALSVESIGKDLIKVTLDHDDAQIDTLMLSPQSQSLQ